ncbi:MAG: zinc finger domain-containing protein, partial [Bacilli bacterium]|nr:zinc finger domain-containing protein [Bacilli bacterium]
KLRDEFASLSKEELARLFVVSKVTLKESGDVEVLKMNTTKCVRCWNYRDDTIKHEDLDLCPRCYSVIKEL